MTTDPRPLVTVAVPVYRRLDTVERALASVVRQDYSPIELLLSDNGGNGDRLVEIADRVCGGGGGYRLRANPETVPVIEHFNQLIDDARGEYFALLCDDDEIGPRFASELAGILAADPGVSLALPRQETVDDTGRTLSISRMDLPSRMGGEEFVRLWARGEHGFRCLVTHMSRTEELRACGGYPAFRRGYHSDDALVAKLCLAGRVAIGSEATFRWQVEDSSLAWSAGYRDLADSSREFARFLREDPWVRDRAGADPGRWRAIRDDLLHMNWRTYHARWVRMRERGMPRGQWLRAALAFPWNGAYGLAVAQTIGSRAGRMVRRLGSLGPRGTEG